MDTKIIGDLHGHIADLRNLCKVIDEPSNIICLGDFGANYYLDKRDKAFKKVTQNYKHVFYVVAGNHECTNYERLGFAAEYDKNVGGVVYIEKEFPNIRYFKRYGIYIINGYKCLVIGGAYSIDKYYRLTRGWQWFEDEQLSGEERIACMEMAAGQHFDFVFTHTCPYKYRPTDLFLPQVDQNTVDNTMEYFLEDIEENITYGAFLWGHYHADRIEAPHCEMFYQGFDSLDTIKNRWEAYEQGESLPWHLRKSPKFYMY